MTPEQRATRTARVLAAEPHATGEAELRMLFRALREDRLPDAVWLPKTLLLKMDVTPDGFRAPKGRT